MCPDMLCIIGSLTQAFIQSIQSWSMGHEQCDGWLCHRWRAINSGYCGSCTVTTFWVTGTVYCIMHCNSYIVAGTFLNYGLGDTVPAAPPPAPPPSFFQSGRPHCAHASNRRCLSVLAQLFKMLSTSLSCTM